MNCVVELFGQLLFATWDIELREVKSYEIRPVDFAHTCQLVFEVAHSV